MFSGEFKEKNGRWPVVFPGSASQALAEKICGQLGVPVGEVKTGHFSDGEVNVRLKKNIRKEEVFIVESTYQPDSHLVELLALIDAARRASAREITAVIPYYGYARQDRKDKSRVPITAKLIAGLIEKAGANRVLTVDFHSSQEQGFFDIPVDHLFAGPLIADWYKKYFLEKGVDIANEVIAVAPDTGAKVVSSLAERLGCPFAMILKKRMGDGKTKPAGIMGDLENCRHAVILDDMISTGNTAVEDAQFLKERGVKNIYLGATHPVFAGNALEVLKNSGIREIVVTNTIPYRHKEEKPENLHYVDVSHLLAKAIGAIFTGGSVSECCFGIEL